MAEHGWTVLGQETVFSKLPDNSIGQVVRITFQTALGVVGVVEVPSKTYSKDTAVAAIDARAQHLDEVQAL